MKLAEDRVCEFLDACWGAGIKDPTRFLLSKRPMVFDWLKGAFPRGILPTDIDGEVEVNGRFLRFEFKHETALRNGHIPKGQHRALLQLAKTTKFTVLIIGIDETGEPRCFQVFASDGAITPLMETTKEKLRGYCSKWSEWAEKRSIEPTPEN